MQSKFGSLKKHQRLDREEQGSDEHLELFQTEMALLFVLKIFGFNFRGDEEEEELKGSYFWLGRVDACGATRMSWLTKLGTGRGQRQELYPDVQGHMLEL